MVMNQDIVSQNTIESTLRRIRSLRGEEKPLTLPPRLNETRTVTPFVQNQLPPGDLESLKQQLMSKPTATVADAIQYLDYQKQIDAQSASVESAFKTLDVANFEKTTATDGSSVFRKPFSVDDYMKQLQDRAAAADKALISPTPLSPVTPERQELKDIARDASTGKITHLEAVERLKATEVYQAGEPFRNPLTKTESAKMAGRMVIGMIPIVGTVAEGIYLGADWKELSEGQKQFRVGVLVLSGVFDGVLAAQAAGTAARIGRMNLAESFMRSNVPGTTRAGWKLSGLKPIAGGAHDINSFKEMALYHRMMQGFDITAGEAGFAPLALESTLPRGTQLMVEYATAVRATNRPGAIGNLIESVPGARQIRRHGPFARKDLTMSEDLHVAQIAQHRAGVYVGVGQLESAWTLVDDAEDVFGAGIRTSGKLDVVFVGDDALRAPFTDTIIDVIERPSLYQLTEKQAAFMARHNLRDASSIDMAKSEFNTVIPKFEGETGGGYMPHIAKDAVIKGGMAADDLPGESLGFGRLMERSYPTAFDRWVADPTFDPITDYRRLLDAGDTAKRSAVQKQVFIDALGAKTRAQLVEENFPSLLTQKKLISSRIDALNRLLKDKPLLNASEKQLEQWSKQAALAHDSIIALGLEGGESYVRLSERFAIAVKQANRAQRKVERLSPEIDDISNQVDKLSDSLHAVSKTIRTAKIDGWERIDAPLFRWVPSSDAARVKQLLSVDHNRALEMVEIFRQTAFGGDIGPILGQQGPMTALWRGTLNPFELKNGVPVPTGRNLRAYIKDVAIAYKASDEQGLLAEISSDLVGYQRFGLSTGMFPNLSSVPEELGMGLTTYLPSKIGKYLTAHGHPQAGARLTGGADTLTRANERMFTAITVMMKRSWAEDVARLKRMGFSQVDAEVWAGDFWKMAVPFEDAVARGLTKGEALARRTLVTSTSFVKSPLDIMNAAARGAAKGMTGNWAAATGTERLAFMRMSSYAAQIYATGILTNMMSAAARGDDIGRAFVEAADYRNARSGAINIGPISIPLGGNMKAGLKAYLPRPVKLLDGREVWLPMGGMWNYAKNRVNPFWATQAELVRNTDWEGASIRHGDAMLQLAQIIAYEAANIMPLSMGVIADDLRHENTGWGTIGRVGTQFTGNNSNEETPYQQANLSIRKWTRENKITTSDGKLIDGYSDLHGTLLQDGKPMRAGDIIDQWESTDPAAAASRLEESMHRGRVLGGDWALTAAGIDLRNSQTESQLKDDTAFMARLSGDTSEETGMSRSEWKNNRHDRQLVTSSQRNQLYDIRQDKFATDDTPEAHYYQKLDELKALNGGIATRSTWEELDGWVSSLPESDKLQIAMNVTFTGVTPVVDDYYKAMDYLNTKGWYDVIDKYAPADTRIGRAYREFIDQDSGEQDEWLRRNAPMSPFVRQIAQSVERDRKIMRQNRVLDAVYYIWVGGGADPVNPLNMAALSRGGASAVYDWLYNKSSLTR